MTKLYVSRYGNKELAKTDAPKVGISLGRPRFKIDYKLEDNIYLLAPPRTLFGTEDKEYFDKKYREHLDRAGVSKIKKALSIYGYGKVEEMILLCFEDITKSEKDWCHRSVFAKWWEEQTGEEVQEYPDPNTAGCKAVEKAKELEFQKAQISMFDL